jgi:hypothetical protein
MRGPAHIAQVMTGFLREPGETAPTDQITVHAPGKPYGELRLDPAFQLGEPILKPPGAEHAATKEVVLRQGRAHWLTPEFLFPGNVAKNRRSLSVS